MAKSELLVDKFLIEFINSDRGISVVDDINNWLVFIIKTLQNFRSKVFMVKGFTQSDKFFIPCLDGLHIVEDHLRALGYLFELLFYMLNMALCWLSIYVARIFQAS